MVAHSERGWKPQPLIFRRHCHFNRRPLAVEFEAELLRYRGEEGWPNHLAGWMGSPALLAELRQYWRSANPKPTTYLFPE